MLKRALLLIFSAILLTACNNPGRRHTEEKRAVQEELTTIDEQQSEHKDPDGAFGAKDAASEARELSNRDTRALEEAAVQTSGD